jgi:anti-anti-sigma factor
MIQAYVEEQREIAIISLEPAYGSLNLHALVELEHNLLHETIHTDPPGLILDLGETVYFGCGLIRVLLRGLRQARERNQRFALCQLREFPREVLETTRLNSLFETFETRDEAIEAMSSWM